MYILEAVLVSQSNIFYPKSLSAYFTFTHIIHLIRAPHTQYFFPLVITNIN